MVGDLGIEPSVRLREGVTVPCHTLRPVAHRALVSTSVAGDYNCPPAASTGIWNGFHLASAKRRASRDIDRDRGA